MKNCKKCDKPYKKNKLFEHVNNCFKYFCQIKIVPKELNAKSFVYFILFTVLSFILNYYWHFDYFGLFFLIFTVILFITICVHQLFIKEMDSIRVLVIGEPSFEKANYHYNKCIDNIYNFLFPMFFVLAFGLGGLLLYSKMKINITLVLVMMYFSIVVFLSMRCYLIYVYTYVYIRFAYKNSSEYSESAYLENNILPYDLAWFKRLNSLSKWIITAFFTVGFLYILGFASFCFLPNFGVKINNILFYILWGLIFIFIVVIFPITAFMEKRYLYKISEKLKTSYIDSLMKFSPTNEKTPLSQLYFISRNNYIFNILSYKTNNKFSYLSNIYALFMWILNFSAAVVTLLQFEGFTLV